jgi:sporulation protein YlmC with PRC-barrel domain
MAIIVSFGALEGDIVVNRRGEVLGTLEHVMINAPQGTIAYVVLACGGVFGLGARLHVVPWEAFGVDSERACLLLDIDKERLDAAPVYDDQRATAAPDSQAASRIREFYGVANARAREPAL